MPAHYFIRLIVISIAHPTFWLALSAMSMCLITLAIPEGDVNPSLFFAGGGSLLIYLALRQWVVWFFALTAAWLIVSAGVGLTILITWLVINTIIIKTPAFPPDMMADYQMLLTYVSAGLFITLQIAGNLVLIWLAFADLRESSLSI